MCVCVELMKLFAMFQQRGKKGMELTDKIRSVYMSVCVRLQPPPATQDSSYVHTYREGQCLFEILTLETVSTMQFLMDYPSEFCC